MYKLSVKIKKYLVKLLVNKYVSVDVINAENKASINISSNGCVRFLSCKVYRTKEQFNVIQGVINESNTVVEIEKKYYVDENKNQLPIKLELEISLLGIIRRVETPVSSTKFVGLLHEDNGEKFGLLNDKKGNLHLICGSRNPQTIKLKSARVSGDKLNLRIERIWSLNRSKVCELILKSRNDSSVYRYQGTFISAKKRGNISLESYEFKISDIFKGDIGNIFDLFIANEKLSLQPELLSRLKTPVFFLKAACKTEKYNGNKVALLESFITMYGGFSFKTTLYDPEAYRLMQKAYYMKYFWRLVYRNVWLVGEKPYKAQDTGLEFYKYLVEDKKLENAYYVIDKSSPEVRNLPKEAKILNFGSAEHVKLACAAKNIVASHYAEDLIPFKDSIFNPLVRAKKIFLQHGVMGVKNMIPTYGVQSVTFSTDLFVVSSKFEKEYIRQDFGFDAKKIRVTGLSRYDNLTPHIGHYYQKTLLIMPTWRDWLNHEKDFLESEYYKSWVELITSSDLHSICKNNGLDVVFCIHPNMQKYSHYFEAEGVRVISQGEVNVQQLLINSHTLITDYSSVGFDFSYLEKLVIYYQFDRSDFLGKRPSHLELDQDLPGVVKTTSQSVLNVLEQSLTSNSSSIKESAIARSKKFFDFNDENNCLRIYEEIKSIRKKTYLSEFSKSIYALVITAKLYNLDKRFRLRKLMYKFLRALPIRQKILFVEANNGKSISDSPAALLREILSRELDIKVVVTTKGNGVAYYRDPRVISVKRLSISYYYYLAVSKYWMNNQNFPSYLRKPKDTIYLQTWHGTPLKKMLHDLDCVYGRSEGYVEKISRCVSEWDYLLSPSNYATQCFKSAFQFSGNVIEHGYPRNDIFFSDEYETRRLAVRESLKINDSTTCILYAPTFRDDTLGNKGAFDLVNLEEVSQSLPEGYVFAVKLHPIDAAKLNSKLPHNVINLSHYSDIQDLMLASDALITDYSSTMFDYVNQEKPVIIYAPDYDKYSQDLRGFYFELRDNAPGEMAFSQSELVDIIKSESFKCIDSERLTQFRNNFCDKNRNPSSKPIVDELLSGGFLK
ncbi:hypothetical protein BCS98_04860 [Vibrio breoganii]|uniref:CDP-glycerol glycerophosphotransferase family protein n=1 Tax=Vibrio breoganii TaxID=553239 RepID=UPI000C81D1C8|nr:CDP-glycerol glycerophosphotransferase family protein [Vibrio breoganii]PMO94255.1 hypothetical protein BCS98_04860 [Vibrio breoganii]